MIDKTLAIDGITETISKCHAFVRIIQRRLDHAFCSLLNHHKVWGGCNFNSYLGI